MKMLLTLTLLGAVGSSPVTAEARFTDRLRERAAAIWEQEMNHPFVKGLGDGSLPLEKFKYYLRQDYRFLVDYARVMALATARANDVATMTRFSDLLSSTLKEEMELQRRFAERLDMDRAELEATVATPTTYAYTRHLLLVAEKGSLTEVVAGVLPCAWGYYEIASRLAQQASPSHHPFYAEWIALYASDESKRYVGELRDLLDFLVEGLPESRLEELEEIFLTSSRYELLFWEMAYRQESWP